MPQKQEPDAVTLDRRNDLLAELRSLSTGLDPVFEETIPYGVAFHRGFCEEDLRVHLLTSRRCQ